MSSKPDQVFPGFGGPAERLKAAGFQRLPQMFGSRPCGGASEPFGAAPVRAAIPVIAVAAIAVKVAVHAHFALEPVMAPAFPAAKPVHAGQHGEPALLAVI